MVLWASSCALLLVAGCGSSVETGANGGTSGGTGACAAFNDEESPASLQVVIRNDTPQPIYLPGLCTEVDYDISPANGPAGGEHVYDKTCLATCETLQHHYPTDCGGCGDQSFRIEPGATLTRTWDGTRLAAAPAMPDACWYKGTPELDGCYRITAATPGDYTVRVTGYGDCQGSCACDAAGKCDGFASGAMVTASPVTVVFPGTKTVEIAFDACAFGCPGSP